MFFSFKKEEEVRPQKNVFFLLYEESIKENSALFSKIAGFAMSLDEMYSKNKKSIKRLNKLKKKGINAKKDIKEIKKINKKLKKKGKKLLKEVMLYKAKREVVSKSEIEKTMKAFEESFSLLDKVGGILENGRSE